MRPTGQQPVVAPPCRQLRIDGQWEKGSVCQKNAAAAVAFFCSLGGEGGATADGCGAITVGTPPAVELATSMKRTAATSLSNDVPRHIVQPLSPPRSFADERSDGCASKGSRCCRSASPARSTARAQAKMLDGFCPGHLDTTSLNGTSLNFVGSGFYERGARRDASKLERSLPERRASSTAFGNAFQIHERAHRGSLFSFVDRDHMALITSL